jgi:hypothetical protein
VPQELARLNADSSIVALGLGEAWLCGRPEQVRVALGWAAKLWDQNGVSIIARYGFAGPFEWRQLDTSSAPTPSDTKWVVRTPVCLDAACSSSMPIYTAHWNMGDLHARQTLEFMAAEPADEPHVMIGDLNVWEGSRRVCNQDPNNTALNILRQANYTDAWAYLHGSAEGFTGMTNRAGCGVPEGYTWKRIDYAWSKNVQPLSMTRFGIVTPGHGAPSDHFGILVEYPHPGNVVTPDTIAPSASIVSPAGGASLNGAVTIAIDATDNRAVARVEVRLDGSLFGTDTTAPYSLTWDSTATADGAHVVQARACDTAGNCADSAPVPVTVSNTPALPPPGTGSAGDIVLHAAHATRVAGAWQSAADATAASGARMWNPNAGAAKVSRALASPANYFELAFYAEAGRAYRLWIRAKAESNHWSNDSAFVQFSGSVTSTGSSIYRIGTTSATDYVLEEQSGAGVSGWGWQDNGYGSGVYGPLIYFAQTGPQTVRIQTREDGLSIDQVVLSPTQYLSTRPGAAKGDTTILPEAAGAAPAATTSGGPVPVTWSAVLNSSGTSGAVQKVSGCNGCAAGAVAAEQISTAGGYVEFTPAAGHRIYAGLGGSGTTPGTINLPYSFSFWPDGGWDVREHNVYRGEGRFSAGDRFRIAVENGAVNYYHNGVRVHVSTLLPSLPLVFDATLLSSSASIANAVIERQ